MNLLIHFKGTPREGVEMAETIARYCECKYAPDGMRTYQCAAHHAFCTDQRFVNGLLTYRHIRNQLRAEEFCIVVGTTDERTEEPK